MIISYCLSYIALGAFAGVLAGLLGVGGGIVIVPVLTFLFTAQQLPDNHIIHLAIGTSLASIIFTSLASFRAHHFRGAVRWEVFRSISPGIITGTLTGSWVAAQLPTHYLKGFFILFLYYVALQIFLNVRPAPTRQLPGGKGMFGVGSLIGGISSLVGIGGGVMSVPFLIWCNLELRYAIGTSAAIGFPIALAGGVGYAANGLAIKTLPSWSLGFVYLPALVCISMASASTAPLGVRLAHTLPVTQLRKFFALFIIFMATKMLMGFMQA
jgi:uncharacterized membrane protein YfcA